MATINTKIKATEKAITKLHKERSKAFSGPDKIYDRINRNLQHTKGELDRLLSWAHGNGISRDSQLPIFAGNTGCTYVRFETLPDAVKDQIFVLEYYRRGSHLYATKNGLAKTLKDAVADV